MPMNFAHVYTCISPTSPNPHTQYFQNQQASLRPAPAMCPTPPCLPSPWTGFILDLHINAATQQVSLLCSLCCGQCGWPLVNT